MNERIRELARRVVGKRRDDAGPIWLVDEQIEKLVELIVRECMFCCDVVEKIEWPSPTTYEFGVEVCKVKIQTHFGVK